MARNAGWRIGSRFGSRPSKSDSKKTGTVISFSHGETKMKNAYRY